MCFSVIKFSFTSIAFQKRCICIHIQAFQTRCYYCNFIITLLPREKREAFKKVNIVLPRLILGETENMFVGIFYCLIIRYSHNSHFLRHVPSWNIHRCLSSTLTQSDKCNFQRKGLSAGNKLI